MFAALLVDLHSARYYLLDELLSVGAHVADSVAVNGEVRLKRFVFFQQTLKMQIEPTLLKNDEADQQTKEHFYKELSIVCTYKAGIILDFKNFVFTI